jgi:hypothetical protein
VSPDLARQLVEASPELYGEGFYFAVGDGWFEVLRRLGERLRGQPVTCVQCKEKFGGLRFYVDGWSVEAAVAIQDAEREAWRTCESCGEPGSLRRGGWLKTLCDRCHGER